MKEQYDEEPRPRKRYVACPDRFCGALDCPRCHPENFRGGIYIPDLERDDDE